MWDGLAMFDLLLKHPADVGPKFLCGLHRLRGGHECAEDYDVANGGDDDSSCRALSLPARLPIFEKWRIPLTAVTESMIVAYRRH